MNVKIDDENKAVYIVLSDQTACESREACPGVIVDYDENGDITGVEVLPGALAGTEKPKNR